MNPRDILAVSFCVNATGENKLRPLIVGRYSRPRCFHRGETGSIQAVYRAEDNVCITPEIFSEYFHTELVPEIQRYHHSRSGTFADAIVLVSERFVPLESPDGKIRCLGIPTALYQSLSPLSGQPISALKSQFKLRILSLREGGLTSSFAPPQCAIPSGRSLRSGTRRRALQISDEASRRVSSLLMSPQSLRERHA